MGVPNDSTRFATAFLVFWIIVTVVLMVLAVTRRLSIPNFLKGIIPGNIVVPLMAFFQLCNFALLLAALAENSWTYRPFPGGWVKLGLVQSRTSLDNTLTDNGDCDTGDDGEKNYCNTGKAAGAFVLIFGLIAIVISFILLLIVGLAAAGRSLPQLNFLSAQVPLMALLQFICVQGMLMIWAVVAHVNLHEADSGMELGASWALCFVVTVLSFITAMHYSEGVGAATAAPAATSAPSTAQETREQPQPTYAHEAQGQEGQPAVLPPV